MTFLNIEKFSDVFHERTELISSSMPFAKDSVRCLAVFPADPKGYFKFLTMSSTFDSSQEGNLLAEKDSRLVFTAQLDFLELLKRDKLLKPSANFSFYCPKSEFVENLLRDQDCLLKAPSVFRSLEDVSRSFKNVLVEGPAKNFVLSLGPEDIQDKPVQFFPFVSVSFSDDLEKASLFSGRFNEKIADFSYSEDRGFSDLSAQILSLASEKYTKEIESAHVQDFLKTLNFERSDFLKSEVLKDLEKPDSVYARAIETPAAFYSFSLREDGNKFSLSVVKREKGVSLEDFYKIESGLEKKDAIVRYDNQTSVSLPKDLEFQKSLSYDVAFLLVSELSDRFASHDGGCGFLETKMRPSPSQDASILKSDFNINRGLKYLHGLLSLESRLPRESDVISLSDRDFEVQVFGKSQPFLGVQTSFFGSFVLISKDEKTPSGAFINHLSFHQTVPSSPLRQIPQDFKEVCFPRKSKEEVSSSKKGLEDFVKQKKGFER